MRISVLLKNAYRMISLDVCFANSQILVFWTKYKVQLQIINWQKEKTADNLTFKQSLQTSLYYLYRNYWLYLHTYIWSITTERHPMNIMCVRITLKLILYCLNVIPKKNIFFLLSWWCKVLAFMYRFFFFLVHLIWYECLNWSACTVSLTVSHCHFNATHNLNVFI